MNLQLKDRVVVEVRGEECSLEQVAATLRAVAEMIEQGRKGGEFPIGNSCDVLWEHESVDYGGFRLLSDKSLISQFIYHSEPRPLIISRETYDKVEQWDRDCEEKVDANNLRYTDGEMCEKAQDIVSSIIKECKPLLK